MKYLVSVLSICTVGLLASSCNEDDESQNENMGQVAFTMEGTNGSSSSGRTLADMEITSATAAVSKVELERDDDDDNEADGSEAEVEFEGEYTVDLLAGASDPAFGMIQAEATTYDKVDIEFGTFLENDASLIIKGTFTTTGGTTIPFAYVYTDDFEIEFENSTGFEVTNGDVREITAKLDFSQFFDGIDFGLAEMNSDQVVVINSDFNTYVYNLINQNFDAAIAIEIEED